MSAGMSAPAPTTRRPEQRALCPLDDWTFSPHYTNGVCPLCGWRPEGTFADPPLLMRIDWFWPSIAALLVVSVIMGVLIVLAYNRA